MTGEKIERYMLDFLLLLALIAFGCAAQEAPAEKVVEDTQKETAVESKPVEATIEEAKPVEEPIAVEPEPIAEPEIEMSKEEKKEFEIFYPNLTYADAYNGPLYATSEQIGEGYPIEKYMANLDRNGVNWFIGFFTFLDKPEGQNLFTGSSLGYSINAVQKYPGRIVPYYNPGMGGEEVESLLGSRLTGIYETNIIATKNIAGDEFIRGIGEIETQEWSDAHNSPRVKQLFDLAKENKINVMFHPVADKISQVEQIAKAYPETKFIIHMYRSDLDDSRSKVIEILQKYDNVYYSIDAAHIVHLNNMDIVYDLEKGSIERSKAAFISEFDSNYKKILSDAVADYKPLVEGAPDKVMWGTEMGPDYSYEPEVYNRMIKISRELIGKMKKEHQEGLGYKNALRAYGEGVTLSRDITVIDSSSWPLCSTSQMNSCDDSCGIEGEAISPEDETCFIRCLTGLKCIDNPEED